MFDETEEGFGWSGDFKSDAVLIELVRDARAVSRYVGRAEAGGHPARCIRCGDAKSAIAGILAMPGGRERLEMGLCALCLREFPKKSTLYYKVLED